MHAGTSSCSAVVCVCVNTNGSQYQTCVGSFGVPAMIKGFNLYCPVSVRHMCES